MFSFILNFVMGRKHNCVDDETTNCFIYAWHCVFVTAVSTFSVCFGVACLLLCFHVELLLLLVQCNCIDRK